MSGGSTNIGLAVFYVLYGIYVPCGLAAFANIFAERSAETSSPCYRQHYGYVSTSRDVTNEHSASSHLGGRLVRCESCRWVSVTNDHTDEAKL